MDDGFEERLVYSESDGSDVDEPTLQISEEPTTQLSAVLSSSIEQHSEILSDQNHRSEESDEDNLNISIKKTKKSARILSSDDENGNSDNGSQVNGKDTNSDDDDPTEHQPKVSVRPSICDSDTSSGGSDGNKSEKEVQSPKIVKKLKKKKNEQRKRVLSIDDDSGSEDDEKTEGNSKKQKKSAKRRNISDQSGSSGSSKSGSNSGSDSNSSSHSNDQSNDNKHVKPREKTEQRMSAKMAEQQMKEIQSESQRFARQLHVSIPYHKPKQHSLKEFLSRRSIVEQQQKLNSKPMAKAAVAIKMSGDELIQYMEDMKKRTQEAEEFFQEEEEEEPNMETNKSDESEDEDWVDKSKTVEAKSADLPEETTESIDIPVNECQESENVEAPTPMELGTAENDVECPTEVMNEDYTENQPTDLIESDPIPLAETPNVIKLHTVSTELDEELDAMILKEAKMERAKLSFPTNHVPKLKGDKGLLIDLETNDLKPVPTSGVDELLSRFMKSARAKSSAVESQDVSIFRSDTGMLERHKFNVNLEDKPKKELKPGEGLFKLRTELGQKIKENRERQIAQRLQEEKEQELSRKELESDDEEELCGEEEEEEFTETEQEGVGSKCEMMDDEAADDEEQANESDENEENSDNDDENSGESESEAAVDLDITEVVKPRKRIVTLDDDDSDDENSLPASSNVAPTENDQADAVSQTAEIQSANQSFDETCKTMNSHDLSALESEILQLDSQTNANTEMNKTETSKLFEECNNEYGEIGESQLMALCSGEFVTQYPDNNSGQNAQPTQNENIKQVTTQKEEIKAVTQSKPAFLSSDEEETDKDTTKKVKKKRKKQTLVYSDDEEDQHEGQDEEIGEEEEEEVEDEEEDIGERYIEYDSDENPVEVELKKSDVKKKASEFVENEAELSDEWDSADEDEKDEMNQYEAELGDSEKFDKDKLRDELERIRLREQIDDDARAIRILTERFVEEEDNGQERERKFRWKHLNNGDDDQVQTTEQDPNAGELNNSDDENEAEWRRIRYEREQMLKQQMNGNESAVERSSVAVEITEQKPAENVTTIFNSSRRISIIKPVGNASSRTASPFLITKTDLSMSHLSRKSFLNRDSPLLEKLASMSKTGADGEAIMNKTKGKGNYVFVATEKKDNSKRKSESEHGAMGPGATNPSKKSKLDPQINTKLRPQTKAFFESLN